MSSFEMVSPYGAKISHFSPQEIKSGRSVNKRFEEGIKSAARQAASVFSNGCSQVYTTSIALRQFIGSIDSYKVMAAANVLTYAPLLAKSVKKALFRQGMHRIDNVVRALFCIRSMMTYLKGSLVGIDHLHRFGVIGGSEVVRQFTGVIQGLAFINFLLAPVNFFYDSRNYYKTSQFLDKFNGVSKELSTKEDADRFFQFLLDTKEIKGCTLSKRFEVNGGALRTQLIFLREEINRTGDYAKLNGIADNLRGRGELTLKNYKVAMVADVVSMFASACIVASIALPFAYILTLAVAATFIGICISRKIASYQTENKLGMIVRDPNTYDPNMGIFWRTWDFTLWLFARHTYHTAATLEMQNSLPRQAPVTHLLATPGLVSAA